MKMHDVPPVVAAVRALADRLAVAVAPAERRCGRDTWIGPAADDAVAVVALTTRHAGEAALALRAAADRIEAAWRDERLLLGRGAA